MPHGDPEKKQAYNREYFQKNKADLLAYQRAWKRQMRAKRTPEQRAKDAAEAAEWQANKKTAEQRARYTAAQCERWNALTLEQKREIAARRREKEKSWPQERIEAKRQKGRAYWHRLTPEQKADMKAKQRAWLDANPDKARAKVNRRRARIACVGGSYTDREWQDLVVRTGNICLKCGISGDDVLLTADHIVPLSKGGPNNIDNIQPLCGPCNSSKGTAIIRYVGEQNVGSCIECAI